MMKIIIMFTNLFLLGFAVAGAAVLWRNLQESSESLRKALGALPALLGKSLTCGSCFTYWLSLFAVILFDPLSGWTLSNINELIHVLLSWFALAFVSVTFRFAYVAIQELVNYQTHTLRKDHHIH